MSIVRQTKKVQTKEPLLMTIKYVVNGDDTVIYISYNKRK